MQKDAFGNLQPALLAGYFLLVMGIGMFVWHPLILLCSLAGGAGYAVFLKGRRAVRYLLTFVLPVALLAAVLNPLFNHRGLTVLFTWHGHEYTMEALLYGLAAGAMFAGILCWCYCFGTVMTSGRIMQVLGKRMPGGALLLSMVLRQIPRYRDRARKVRESREMLGEGKEKGFLPRLKEGTLRLSMVTTWALENSVETADVMTARGYGSGRRTFYGRHKRDARDAVLFDFLLPSALFLLIGLACGLARIWYFPTVQPAELTGSAAMLFILYGIICFLPLLLNGKEALSWRASRSRM